MKKFAMVLAAALLLTSNAAQAQTTGMPGGAASAGTYNASSFAWGIGLTSLAVIGIVVGITAGAASSSPSTFSH